MHLLYYIITTDSRMLYTCIILYSIHDLIMKKKCIYIYIYNKYVQLYMYIVTFVVFHTCSVIK